VRAALHTGDELIVVDSASVHADAVHAVGIEHADRVVRLDRAGVDRARNAGWRAAAHDILLFTDDDVVVDEGWADALARAVAAHPDAGFVTGRIDKPPGPSPTWRDVALKRDTEPQVFGRRSVVNLGHGASLAVRRAALESVRGFDEALGAGGHFRAAPEVDLFDRLLAAGWVGRYDPVSLAYHEQWRDIDEIVALDFRYGVGNGARLAKLVRADLLRAVLAWRVAVWDDGLVPAASAYRKGARKLAKAALLRVFGTFVGFVRGLATPVVDGHYRLRSDS
jgi:glycosyltransferase involved in cell wall biosynthesis